ncbi:hypothetical protein ACOME3_010320 [Neoechinorhynchus agilis]
MKCVHEIVFIEVQDGYLTDKSSEDKRIGWWMQQNRNLVVNELNFAFETSFESHKSRLNVISLLVVTPRNKKGLLPPNVAISNIAKTAAAAAHIRAQSHGGVKCHKKAINEKAVIIITTVNI